MQASKGQHTSQPTSMFRISSVTLKLLFCPEHSIQVEVIDGIEDWMRLMRSVFHFPALRRLVQSEGFSFVFDGMNGVAGPTARRLFVDELGADPKCLKNCTPLVSKILWVSPGMLIFSNFPGILGEIRGLFILGST